MKEKILDEDGYSIRPNKTQIKKDIESLRTLAEILVELPVGKFEKLSVDKELAVAVVAARKMKKSAMQRQLRFIIGILKNYEDNDVLKIQRQYEMMMLPQQQENKALHQLEEWRDKLIAGDNALINKMVEEYDADRQYLRQLIRNINKEQKQQDVKDNTPIEMGDKKRLPKTARVLFKYLQELSINKG